MKLVSTEQMRAVDGRAINDLKIPSLELMENAGRGIFDYIDENILPFIENPKIAVVCGRGNNGGDGFVVGRYLLEKGHSVAFYLSGSDDKLSDDCRVNYDKVKAMKIDVVQIISVDALPDLSEYDLIIDAIFGTGFSGAPRGITADFISRINDADTTVVAVDAPSGMDVSTGQAEGEAVLADYTTTLALPKPGLFVSPGREFAGITAVIPIGIPNEVEEYFDIKTNLITGEMASEILLYPPADAHKGDMGKVFIVGGSTGLTGAITLAGLAAARSGAGLTTVGVPASLNPVIETKLTEVMSAPLPEIKKKAALALRARGEIRRWFAGRDAIGIGPGIGRHHETIELVQRLIADLEVPAVIDADGLYAVAQNTECLKDKKVPLVLTPHPGEFERLTGIKPDDNPINNFDLVLRTAKDLNCVIILKGSPTIIGSPGGEVYLNPTGNWGMASGGSGDVLTGIITAFLGQGLTAIEAAITGVYIHGLAGDIAIGDIHPRSLIPCDVIDYLSDAFEMLDEAED